MTPVDTLWPALAIIVPSFCSVFGAVVIAWMQNKTKQAVVSTGAAAATKVEEVKDTLQAANAATGAKLGGLEKVAKDTHTLVNSNMGVQLKLAAALSKRLADMTKATEDVAEAIRTEAMYQEHMAKQAIVDAGKPA
jgi:nitrogen fixation/metabolism regulation signal transduction histidine kinase